MNNKKIFVDAQNTTRNAQDKNNPFSTRDDSFKKRKVNGKQRNGTHKGTKELHGALKPDSECPIHGGHLWVKCFDNPNDNSFKPRRRLRRIS
jgi:hypothetical protein